MDVSVEVRQQNRKDPDAWRGGGVGLGEMACQDAKLKQYSSQRLWWSRRTESNWKTGQLSQTLSVAQ